MKNNTYFQAMHQTRTETARENGRKASFTEGQNRAYHAWCSSLRDESSAFEVQELPWAEDTHDFVETLRAAGISEFAVTDHSSALMGSLHRLAEEGCTMQGFCRVTRSAEYWGAAGCEGYEGILFRT